MMRSTVDGRNWILLLLLSAVAVGGLLHVFFDIQSDLTASRQQSEELARKLRECEGQVDAVLRQYGRPQE